MIPLADNQKNDKYLYEIIVYTGNKKQAQTDSMVQFIVSGDHGETNVRTFSSGKKDIFKRDSIDSFVMATSR